MNNRQWGTRKQYQSKKLPKQEIQKITQRQYQKAMKHQQRISFNQLNKTIHTQPLDPQCTFQPQIYSSKRSIVQKETPKDLSQYRTKNKNDGHQNPQQRLMQWGIQRKIKRRQNMLTAAVQAQKIKQVGKKKEVKQTHPEYTSKSFCRTGRSQLSILLRNKYKSPSKLGIKKKSETTFISQNNVKSKSSLLSRLLQ